MFGLGLIRDMAVAIRLKDEVSGTLRRVNQTVDVTKNKLNEVRASFSGLFAVSAALTAVGAVTGAMTRTTIGLERAMQELQARTGVTDKELQHLQSTLIRLAQTNSNSFQEIGGAMTVLRQRWGALGSAMQPVTQQMLDFAKVTGTDAVQAANNISVVMKAFGMDISQVADATDLLLAASQRYGVEAARLAELISDNGAALKLLGLDISEAIGLLASMESQGVNVARVLMGLRQAAAKGIDVKETLKALAQIEDKTLRTKKATEIFGSYAGPGISRILEGGIESLNKFMLRLEDVRGVTKKASRDIDESLSEQLGILRNNIALVTAELGKGLMPILKPFTGLVKSAAQAFSALPAPVKAVLSSITALVGVIGAIGGPLLMLVAGLGFASSAGITLVGVLTLIGKVMLFVGAATGAIVAAVTILSKVWESNFLGIRNRVIEFWGVAKAVFAALKVIFSAFWATVKDTFTPIVDLLKEFGLIGKDAGKSFQGTFKPLIDWLSRNKETLREFGRVLGWIATLGLRAFILTIYALVKALRKLNEIWATVKENIEPIMKIASFAIPGVGQLKLAGELATKAGLPTPAELAAATIAPGRGHVTNINKTVGKIEIKVEGAGDPDKVAEKVVKKIEKQFMGM